MFVKITCPDGQSITLEAKLMYDFVRLTDMMLNGQILSIEESDEALVRKFLKMKNAVGLVSVNGKVITFKKGEKV
jgi:uncharacterized protein YlzI (FlbEa/FlbD family)